MRGLAAPLKQWAGRVFYTLTNGHFDFDAPSALGQMPALPVIAGIGAKEDATFRAEDFGPPLGIPLGSVCFLGSAIGPGTVAACRAGRLATSGREMPEVTAIALVRHKVVSVGQARVGGTVGCFVLGVVLRDGLS